MTRIEKLVFAESIATHNMRFADLDNFVYKAKGLLLGQKLQQSGGTQGRKGVSHRTFLR